MIRTVALSLLAVSIVAPSFAADLEGRAKALEGKLMAPCCMANTVAQHESGVAHEMRRDIRRMLDAGRSEQEILDGYVERYGEQILALPRASGFNLVAFLLPFLLLIGGAVLLVRLVRTWSPAAKVRPSPCVPIEAEYAERLREALKRY